MVLAAKAKTMKNRNKTKSLESGHAGPTWKRKATDSHLPFSCTTDGKAMILIGLKPLKSAHDSKS
jgi:hypothetical protein